MEQDRAPALFIYRSELEGTAANQLRTVINLIGGAKTRTGLKVQAVLDENDYETGIKVSAEQLKEIGLRRHKVHPEWNYTISPRARN